MRQAVSEKAKRGTGQRVKSPLWLYLIGFPLTSSLELLTRMAYLELLVRRDGVTWHGLPYQQASEYTDSQAKIFFYCYSLSLQFLRIFLWLTTSTYQLKMISSNSYLQGLGYLYSQLSYSDLQQPFENFHLLLQAVRRLFKACWS